ncbi:MAG: nucleotidyltransferase [Myxococcota bacterium]|jgi:hypothetical protein|nr:nucleotidyltransferase [Myxococcota bacterium]
MTTAPRGDLERIFYALEQANVRYLVVGGVAVVLHGHPRLTADLDLVVALEPANVRSAVEALANLGYRPRAPIPLAAFADPEQRRAWIEEKGLTVLSLASPEFPLTEVDLFAAEPIPFEPAYARALSVSIGGVRITAAGLEDLIALKRRAGRPKDLADVEALEAIARERGEDGNA